MAEARKYVGSCHCGRVRYEVTADLSQVISCNCSMCQRAGHLLTFAPESEFKLLSGDDALVDYQFNKHVIHHLFCSTCGVRSFGRGTAPDGTPTVSINARCLEGVDAATLDVMHFDGRSR
jgi:hypothetical protein